MTDAGWPASARPQCGEQQIQPGIGPTAATAARLRLLAELHEAVGRPDIAIEVVRTSGGLNKLEVYTALEVPEVWFWQQGRLSVYGLADGQYQPIERSRKLPEPDPRLIESCMGASTQTAAIQQLRYALAQTR